MVGVSVKKIEQLLDIFQRKQYNLSVVKFPFLPYPDVKRLQSALCPARLFWPRFIFAL
jgi:hypothetical protein